MELLGSPLVFPASVPDLFGERNVQNRGITNLDDTQEIYENYGALRGSYPYAHFNTYTRELTQVSYQAAILENDYLRAVFLPELGGRLWQLYDKEKIGMYCIKTM